eukprot:5817381-Prymnesium_polylepis.2
MEKVYMSIRSTNAIGAMIRPNWVRVRMSTRVLVDEWVSIEKTRAVRISRSSRSSRSERSACTLVPHDHQVKAVPPILPVDERAQPEGLDDVLNGEEHQEDDIEDVKHLFSIVRPFVLRRAQHEQRD